VEILINYSADALRRVTSGRCAAPGFPGGPLQFPSAVPSYLPHQLEDVSHVKPNQEEKANDGEDPG
jgi:hypothetical protein